MRILLSLFVLGGTFAGAPVRAGAATIAPPMLDINRQCGSAHRSATATSECIVAESEARADILQNWTKYSDASAEKCVKLSLKARRQPYTAMSRCLSVEIAESAAAPQAVSDRPTNATAPAATTGTPASATATPGKDTAGGGFFHGLRSFFTAH